MREGRGSVSVNVVGSEGAGTREGFVEVVEEVVLDENTRRLGMVSVKWRVGEGSKRKWKIVAARRMVVVNVLRVDWLGRKLEGSFAICNNLIV
jgi:hypothetical protein